MDIDDNSILDMDELLQGMILASNKPKEEKIVAAFLASDRDGNSTLDLEELSLYLFNVIRFGYKNEH